MRVILTLTAVAFLAACNMPQDAPVASAPVRDNYTTTASGVAVYQGNVNIPGSRLPGDTSPVPPAPGTEFATVGATVYFTESDATLSDEARATLTRQAAWLEQNAGFAAVVEGHADEPGTREFNLALGARRATSVREYLVSKGVDARRVRTVSYGQERPAAICASEAACLARNRRAVTVVSPVQAGV